MVPYVSIYKKTICAVIIPNDRIVCGVTQSFNFVSLELISLFSSLSRHSAKNGKVGNNVDDDCAIMHDSIF